MKFRSYKQVTVSADIEYGEEVDVDGLINQIDWKKAILYGVEFEEKSFLYVSEGDWDERYIVHFCKPRKPSIWKKIFGDVATKIVHVKAEMLKETLLQFWPKEDGYQKANPNDGC